MVSLRAVALTCHCVRLSASTCFIHSYCFLLFFFSRYFFFDISFSTAPSTSTRRWLRRRRLGHAVQEVLPPLPVSLHGIFVWLLRWVWQPGYLHSGRAASHPAIGHQTLVGPCCLWGSGLRYQWPSQSQAYLLSIIQFGSHQAGPLLLHAPPTCPMV